MIFRCENFRKNYRRKLFDGISIQVFLWFLVVFSANFLLVILFDYSHCKIFNENSEKIYDFKFKKKKGKKKMKSETQKNEIKKLKIRKKVESILSLLLIFNVAIYCFPTILLNFTMLDLWVMFFSNFQSFNFWPYVLWLQIFDDFWKPNLDVFPVFWKNRVKFN